MIVPDLQQSELSLNTGKMVLSSITVRKGILLTEQLEKTDLVFILFLAKYTVVILSRMRDVVSRCSLSGTSLRCAKVSRCLLRLVTSISARHLTASIDPTCEEYFYGILEMVGRAIEHICINSSCCIKAASATCSRLQTHQFALL